MLGAVTVVTVITCALLLMAGDIESNPGPTAARKTKQSVIEIPSSPKVPTTPTTSKQNAEELRDIVRETVRAELNQAVDRIRVELNDLKDRFVNFEEEIKTVNRALNDKIQVLENDNIRLNSEIQRCVKIIDQQALKLDDLEARSRRNNIIIHGIPQADQNETWDQCERAVTEMLSKKMGISGAQIDRAHRLGSRNNGKSPIIVRFSNYKERQSILKNRGKLRGSDVYINEDFTSRVREIRGKLSPFLKKMREEGKRVNMIYDHLVVDGQRMDYDQESNDVIPVRRQRQRGPPSPSQSG